MSIADEITRIKNAKDNLKEAINSKGGTLTNETLDQYAAAVNALLVFEESGSAGSTEAITYYKCTEVNNEEVTHYFTTFNGSDQETEITYSGEETLTKEIWYHAIEENPATDPETGKEYTEYGVHSSPKSEEWLCDVYMNMNDSTRYLVIKNHNIYQGLLFPDQDSYEIDILEWNHYVPNVTTDYTLEAVGSSPRSEVEIIKKWSGQKAVLTDGVYSFEETVTTGLTYGNGFTPQVGSIYNADATVRVDKMFEGSPAVPEDGLIFYLPFNGNAEPVEGEITSTTGELTYGEVNGIKYAVFDGSQAFVGKLDAVPDAYSISVTFMVPEVRSGAVLRHSGSMPVGVTLEVSNIRIGTGSHPVGDYTAGQFCNIIMTAESGGNTFCYVNGVVATTQWGNGSYRYDLSETFTLARPTFDYDGYAKFAGNMLDVAVWNRVLTEEEIAQIAARAASMNG